MTEERKSSFLIFCDNEILLRHLTDEQSGKLFKALFSYAARGEEPDLGEDPAVLVAFDIFRLSIDRNAAKYEAICKARRENGRKGGLAKANNAKLKLANARNAKQNVHDSDIDSDTDSDNAIYQQIADIYNGTCLSLPKVCKLNDDRKKVMRARLKNYKIDDFRELFSKAERSDFLTGKSEKGWKANFDWLLEENNMTKVLEGNYKNRDSHRSITGSSKMSRYTPEEFEDLEEQLLMAEQ